MKIFSLLASTLLVSVTTTFATIYKVSSLAQASKIFENHRNGQQRSVFLLDADNTLVHPAIYCPIAGDKRATHIGSDQWFRHLVNQTRTTVTQEVAAQKHTLHETEITHKAVARALVPYFAAHAKLSVNTCEHDTAELVRAMQQTHQRVMVITKRSQPMVEHTLRQFSEIGLGFHDANQPQEALALDMEYGRVVVSHNIIFCGNNHKGSVFTRLSDVFGDKFCEKPDIVGIADDRLDYVEEVQETLSARGIEVIGFHYTGMDQHVANFHSMSAEIKAQLAADYQQVLGEEEYPQTQHSQSSQESR